MGHPRTPAREIIHLHGPDPLQSLWAEGTNYCCRGSEPERGRIRDLEGQGRSNVSSLGGISSALAAFLRVEQKRCCEPDGLLL